MPRYVSYTVGAIFEVGVYDYDKAYVVMPIQDAQTLMLMGDEVGMIEVETVDAEADNAPALALYRRAAFRDAAVDVQYRSA